MYNITNNWILKLSLQIYMNVQITWKSTVCCILNPVETLPTDKHLKNCVTPRSQTQNVDVLPGRRAHNHAAKWRWRNSSNINWIL